jgi:hypothetical protein
MEQPPADVGRLIDLAVRHPVGRGVPADAHARIGRRLDEVARLVELRHAVGRQDALDLRAVGVDELLDPRFPFAFAEAHAHGHGVVEANLGVGAEGNDRDLRARDLLREIACHRAPHEGNVDLSGHQVLLDHLARVLFGVAGLPLVGHCLVEQLVAQQPVHRRGLGEHAEL